MKCANVGIVKGGGEEESKKEESEKEKKDRGAASAVVDFAIEKRTVDRGPPRAALPAVPGCNHCYTPRRSTIHIATSARAPVYCTGVSTMGV